MIMKNMSGYGKHDIKINNDKCTGCGQCQKVCIGEIIKVEDKKAKIIDFSRCLECFHCYAICPEQAISIEGFEPDIDKGISELLSSKRSCRHYKDEKLPYEVIEKVLENAQYAPSACNLRRNMYYVIDEKEKIKEMEELSVASFLKFSFLFRKPLNLIKNLLPAKMKKGYIMAENFMSDLKEAKKKGTNKIFRGAPCIMVIAGVSDYKFARDDAIYSLDYAMLKGHEMGLGSCIIGFAQALSKPLGKYLKIPKGFKIYAVAIFGYPAVEYKRGVPAKRTVKRDA